MSNDLPTQILNGFSKILSQHGHGFHYSVMRRAEELRLSRKSLWSLEATEFPVIVHGEVTHVDFILKSDPGRTFLVAECKRADQGRAKWCFVSAPYTWPGKKGDELLFEKIDCTSSCRAGAHVAHTDRGSYHLGIELRCSASEERGDGRSAINKAAAQVLRGVNGIVGHLFGGPTTQFFEENWVRFLPVVFTTAELWVSTVDLREADLKTGQIMVADATRVDWLWFTHNQSPGLRHSIPGAKVQRVLSADLQREFARTIAIVSPTGIDSFLAADLETWLG